MDWQRTGTTWSVLRMSKAPKPDTVKPKIILRGTQEFRHDLFKSDVKKFLKNLSFSKGKVEIVGIEHTHIFHSHSSQGVPLKYTNAVGGHYHAVTVSVDPDGTLRAKCGPPLRNAVKKKPSGQKKVVVPVKWHNEEADMDNGQSEWVEDTHTHDFTYIASEFLSVEKVKQTQDANRAAIQASMATHRAAKAEETAAGGDGDAA
jgi:hypothetical protein